MSDHKKHHEFEEESFEHFLDHLDHLGEEDDALGTHAFAPGSEAYKAQTGHAEKRSSLAALVTKVSLLTVIVMSSLLWFFWPQVGVRQADGSLNKFATQGKLTAQNQFAALEQSTTLKKITDRLQVLENQLIEKHDIQVSHAQQQEIENKAQQKAEALKVAKKKAKVRKLAQQKADALKVAKEKAKAKNTAEQKANALKAAKKKAKADSIQKKVIATSAASEKVNPHQVQNRIHTQNQAIKHQTVFMAGTRYDIFKIAVNVANVRSAPVAGAAVVAKLKYGTKVIVFKQEGDWMKIRLPHKRPGWIYHTLLK